MQPFAHRLRDRTGQTAAEYMGVLVIVAAIIGALATSSAGTAVANATRDAICEIAGGDCTPRGSGGTGTSPPPEAPPAPPPVDQGVVDDAVDEIRDLTDGMNPLDYARALATLLELSPAELDAVLAELSDAEIARMFGVINLPLIPGDLREAFYEHIIRTASPETLERLGRLINGLHPAFDEVGGDDADDDPDHPIHDAEYGTVPHQLFIAGEDDGGEAIHPNDVDQGAIGDCWLMTGLIATAQEHPELIEDMIERNPNGTYTVTFMDGDDPMEITVTADVPLNDDGEPIFAEFPVSGTDRAGADHELWPMIIEKAYARYQGDYHEIEGGHAEDALEAITGVESDEHDTDDLSLDELADIRQDGGAIVLSSRDDEDDTPLYEDGTLVPEHAYYVTDVDPSAGTVTVRNPWGYHYDPITLSYEDFMENFDRVGINALVD